VEQEGGLVIEVSRRVYACPVCGGRTLRGHTYKAEPNAVTIDRYMLPYAAPNAEVFYHGSPLRYRSLSRFTLYFCPHDLLILDSPIVFKAGLTQVDEDQVLFHRGNLDWISVAGKGMTFDKLFWLLIDRYRGRLVEVDWYRLVSDAQDEKVLALFNGKPSLFNSLVNTALSCPDGRDAARSRALLDRVFEGGLFGLLGYKPFAERSLSALMFDFKMLHYALKVARDNDMVMEIGRQDPLHTIGGLLGKRIKSGLLDKGALGRLMMTALKRIRFARTALEIWKLKMLALLSSELLILSGDYDYSDPSVISKLVYYNNEAIKYLNLLLRKELRFDNGFLSPRERIEGELVRALNHSDIYFLHGHSSRAVQRAVRLGERIREFAGKHLGIGFD